MEDNKCVKFLQWALPQCHMRWKGFRKVRRQVCKRVNRRVGELGLPDIESYKAYLADNREEWKILDHFCRITISRFYRDPIVFDYLGAEVLPALAHSIIEENSKVIRVWCAGCASGEEPYTFALIWHYKILPLFPALHLEIIATDIDPVVIERAEKGCYRQNSLNNLPSEWVVNAFDQHNDLFSLKPPFKESVLFLNLDVRKESPAGFFHMIFCRNLVFTYFDSELQQSVLHTFHDKLADRGVLISGTHEMIPDDKNAFTPWVEHMPIFRKS